MPTVSCIAGSNGALKLDEIVLRNVAHAVPLPKVEDDEMEILTAEQVAETLRRIADHPLYPIVKFAVTTGLRRGEICGLALGCLDLDAGKIRVERSLEETQDGLRFKPPKTRHGHRTVTLPGSTIEVMREHCRRQLELRLRLGLGRPDLDDLVFTLPDGSPYPPDKLSRDWGNLVRDRKLPKVMFHALRHSHASALIAAGVDIVTTSRRLGHGSPAITLRVYSHLFSNKSDDAAASAVENAFGS